MDETPPRSRAEMEALAGLRNVVATVVPTKSAVQHLAELERQHKALEHELAEALVHIRLMI